MLKLLVFVLCLIAPHVMAATPVPPTQSGEVYAPTGDIPNLIFKGLHYDPALIVDLSGATVHRVEVNASSGIILRGGKFSVPNGKDLVYVVNSSNITLTQSDLLSNSTAYCVRIADSTDISVIENRLDRCFQGVNAGRVRGLTVSANTVIGANNDSFAFYGISEFVIEFNAIAGNLRLDGRHPDGMQFVKKANDPLINNHGVVRYNTVAGPTQGIFGAADYTVFEYNFTMVDHGNAQSISGIGNTVRHATVITMPYSTNIANMNYWDATTTRCDNKVLPFKTKKGFIEAPC